jgi:hypothetical protein
MELTLTLGNAYLEASNFADGDEEDEVNVVEVEGVDDGLLIVEEMEDVMVPLTASLLLITRAEI